MATPEEIKAAAEKAKKQAAKPLPAMASPTVNLALEIRKAVAIRCKDVGESFSHLCNVLVIALLKKEGRIATDLAVDLTPKKGGGGGALKAQLAEKDVVIGDLQKQIDALKAAKK